jgi:hypothetical protein
MSQASDPSSAATRNAVKKNFAASVKAIMHARHTNTGRNIKRGGSGPWIGEVIVVKEYDQMDSLREILEKDAKQSSGRVDEVEKEECVAKENARNVVEMKEEQECGLKRRRDDYLSDSDSESIDSPTRQISKKRRVMSDARNQTEPESELEKLETVEEKMQVDTPKGKENVAPVVQVLFCSSDLMQPIREFPTVRKDVDVRYTWAALLQRVDTHFGVESTPVATSS